ncbi:MAG: ABC transporter substrate-binding protein [Acidobacteria bacterium RIFCSPLOWO2_12_FULL_67_14]|nr:MAG: ABC transporter substrate-binding protein [Acidobacteria bacterium RIFCSPLOWO2_02_FULL_67_21]OFW39415.1 MAG: ABC transporter substrate-binding protein [Acidobacteria bacterium RIFCSPLOWO2_12_FULL_67_14]
MPARSELAPAGTLRAGINFGNVLLTKKDPATGEPGGVAVDMARELARRLNVPIQIVPYDSAGALADAAGSGVWDVGFLGAEPQRANEIDFTAAYAEIESTYLVPPGSPIQRLEEVDRPGVRIAIAAKSAYDLYLSRNLKSATLERAAGADVAFRRMIDEKLDAMAGLRPVLVTYVEKLPGSRVLDGSFSSVQQAAGTPKGRPAGAAYLREFIEDAKQSGFVAQSIEKNGVRGLTVAPPAPASN